MNLILIKSYLDKKNILNETKKELNDKQKLKIINYSCMFLPYKKDTYIEKKHSFILSKTMCNKKLLLPKAETNDIMFLIEGQIDLIEKMKKEKEKLLTRYEIGLYLMKYKFQNINNIIKLAICEEYLDTLENKTQIIEDIKEISIKNIIDKYMEIIVFIELEKLENIDKIKPLIDGKKIKEILGIKDGKYIKKYLDIIIKEQINNANITIEQCMDIIKKEAANLDK